MMQRYLVALMLTTTCACTGTGELDPTESNDTPTTETVEEATPSTEETTPSEEESSEPTTPEETEPEPEPEQPVIKFVALGDGGEGNETQFAVADAMKRVCEDKGGCDFALYLGDNFYDDGISRSAGGIEDPQFDEKFEQPYANLSFPFYVVLGNHDYGELSLLAYKADYEVEYHHHSEKWHMPSRFYSERHQHAEFFGLDTNAFMVGNLMPDIEMGDQWDWFHDAVSRSDATWKIAFGHHPYISNGSHGNAGNYEGYDWLPFFSGIDVQTFMETEFCGEIDVYFAGHDHNRQWLEPSCGTEFIVSGAAAKTTDLVGRGTPTFFEDDTLAGFMYVEIVGDTLTGEFYDINGEMDFSRVVVKQ